jgi:hypothetical protein
MEVVTKAKTVTNNLPILSVLGVGCVSCVVTGYEEKKFFEVITKL